MNIQSKQFAFCPPLFVDKKSRPKKVHSSLFTFGAWGDKFASFSRDRVKIIGGKETFHKVEHYALKTALKILVFALTLFILPAIALIAKIGYKNFCSKHIPLITPSKNSKNLPIQVERTTNGDYEALIKSLLAQKAQEDKNAFPLACIRPAAAIAPPSSTSQHVKNSKNQKSKERKNYHYDTFDTLLNIATKYIQKEKIKNKERSPIKMPLTKELSEKEIIDHWFEHYQGFCLGEDHTNKAPKEFLVDNMAYLKEKGVKVIFMEQLYDHQQADLDGYYLGLPISDDILENLNRADKKDKFQIPYGFKGVVEAAKKEGIRIVAIDTRSANYNDDNIEKRWLTMNYFAYKTIKQTMRELGENAKFVAMMGSGHLTKRKNIPGVSNLLDCPNMMVADLNYTKTPIKKIKFNALVNAKLDLYTVDLYYMP